MKLRLITAALAASASLFAVPAQAAVGGPGSVACGDSLPTVFAAGYAGDCQGPLVGTIGTGAVATATFGSQLYTLIGTTLDASGAFSASPVGEFFGELQLAALRTGPFVLGLQAGGTYSLYLFNGGSAGLSSIEFDTYGLALNGPNLTQAALFAAAVPEPGTYAFMLTGLLVLGFLAQRRRAAEPRR